MNVPLPSANHGAMKRNIIIAAVVLALIMAGSFGFRMFMMMKMGGGGFGGKDFAVAINAAPPRAEKVNRVVDVVGTLRADQAIEIAPELSGRITEIADAEGKAVKKGDVLVHLDQTIVAADYAESAATHTAAQANYERARSLAARSFATQQSKDDALAALRRAEAQLASSKARSEKMLLVAPFDGMLGLRQQSVGAYVNAGTPIITLTSVDPMLVDFRVPELKSAFMAPGQKVQVTLDALPGRVFDGVVAALDPRLDEAGRSLMVRARLANPDGVLRAGMFARVSVQYGEAVDVLVVPERAIFLKGDDVYLYRVVDGKAEEVKVALGERRVGEVEIIKGIQPHDDVVTDGQIKLRPGAKVMLLNKPNVPEGAAGKMEEEKKLDVKKAEPAPAVPAAAPVAVAPAVAVPLEKKPDAVLVPATPDKKE